MTRATALRSCPDCRSQFYTRRKTTKRNPVVKARCATGTCWTKKIASVQVQVRR